MVHERFRFAWLVLFAVFGIPAVARSDEPFRYPEAKHGKGELKYRNGVPVLTVEGTPEEIGEQVAVLAAKPAERLFRYPKEVLKEIKAEFAYPLLTRTGKLMLPQFPDDYRKELDAFVKAGFDRDLLIVANTMFDIQKLFACSSLVVDPDRSATKGSLLARNLDFVTLGYLQDYSLVTVYRPAGKKHAFVSVGFPGIIGCLSGMNETGLSLAVLEVYSSNDGALKFDPKGVPYAMCYRRILEECSTVEEAKKLLESMKRTTMTNLAICDKKGGGVLEITPKSLVFRPAAQSLSLCTNHFCSPELAVENQPNTFQTLDRFASLEKTRDLTKIGIEDLHQQLHAANLGECTLQTMVFEPATLTIHVAFGKCPTSALPLKTIRPFK